LQLFDLEQIKVETNSTKIENIE